MVNPMTRFRSKPEEISAEQFFPDSPVWPKHVSNNGRYRYSVFNKLHASYIDVHPGDWVRTDDDNNTYPITDKDMKEHYEKVS
jgi:hypothetical protein